MLGKLIQNLGRKQIATVVLLGCAAAGASRIPGSRTAVVDSTHEQVVVATQVMVPGSNNLLGGIASSELDKAAQVTDLSEQHLVSGLSLSQAGELSVLDRLHGLTGASDEASIGSGQLGLPLGVNAVPEPAMAGIMMAALVPALIRRRRVGLSVA